MCSELTPSWSAICGGARGAASRACTGWASRAAARQRRRPPRCKPRAGLRAPSVRVKAACSKLLTLLARPAHLLERVCHRAAHRAGLRPRPHQQARPRHGREWHADQQLGVVAAPHHVVIRVCPGLVKHVLPVAVRLQVHGAAAQQRARRVPHQHVLRGRRGGLEAGAEWKPGHSRGSTGGQRQRIRSDPPGNNSSGLCEAGAAAGRKPAQGPGAPAAASPPP